MIFISLGPDQIRSNSQPDLAMSVISKAPVGECDLRNWGSGSWRIQGDAEDGAFHNIPEYFIDGGEPVCS